MARPLKLNADYFSHDASMRDDPRVKAIRRKFGLRGYAIWCMLLEVLTDSENFKHKFNDLSIELLSGDFDIEPDILDEMVQYMITLELLQSEGGFLRCLTLEKRFEGLISKRERQRNQVIDDDNTQSKVK